MGGRRSGAGTVGPPVTVTPADVAEGNGLRSVEPEDEAPSCEEPLLNRPLQRKDVV